MPGLSYLADGAGKDKRLVGRKDGSPVRTATPSLRATTTLTAAWATMAACSGNSIARRISWLHASTTKVVWTNGKPSSQSPGTLGRIKMGAMMRNGLLAISLIILGGGMSACTGTSDIDWKEEVRLNDGRIIVVEREAIYVGGGDEWAFNRGGGKIDEERIRFTSPDGADRTIEWRSTKKSPGTYPEIPLLLDLPAGQPTVFTLVAISNGCEVYSKYVYQQGAWVEESLPEQFRQQTTNLLFGSQRDLPELLTLAEKNKRNSGDGYRKALKQIGPNRKVCG